MLVHSVDFKIIYQKMLILSQLLKYFSLNRARNFETSYLRKLHLNKFKIIINFNK